MLKISACLTALLLGGCASITGTHQQPVSVQTTQGSEIVSGASCTLSNDAGKWFVKSPGSVIIKKSTGDLLVECARDDLAGFETVISKANTNVWGNLLLGGIIGYAVDRNSGAGFDYPGAVTVRLEQARPAGVVGQNVRPTATGPEDRPHWRAVMSCGANRYFNDSKPLHVSFIAEVNGDRVTLHRKNKVAEEVLSGVVRDKQMQLDGVGYRLQAPLGSWTYKFDGQFTRNGRIYSGNGDMLAKTGQSTRSCTLVMVLTDVDPQAQKAPASADVAAK